MSRRFTKKSLVNVPGRLVKHAVIGLPGVRVQRTQAADEHGHLGRAQRQPEGPLDQQMLGGHLVSISQVVAEPVRVRLEHGERFHVGLLLRRIRASGREGHLHVVSGVLRRLLDGCASAEHDQVGKRDLLLPAGLRVVERLLNPSRVFSTFASSGGLLTAQSFCGARRMRAPLAPPRLSVPRNDDADAQAVETS